MWERGMASIMTSTDWSEMSNSTTFTKYSKKKKDGIIHCKKQVDSHKLHAITIIKAFNLWHHFISRNLRQSVAVIIGNILCDNYNRSIECSTSFHFLKFLIFIKSDIMYLTQPINDHAQVPQKA